MTEVASATVAPVRKTITVDANIDRAFKIFADGFFDTWWPRSHHIGTSPMRNAILEPRAGGRCYSGQEDGTEVTREIQRVSAASAGFSAGSRNAATCRRSSS